jgi:hypothetical protein
VIPLLGDRASLDASAVEVRDHGGPVDFEPVGELPDGVASLVMGDECIDIDTSKLA